jgi:hypothetical protein
VSDANFIVCARERERSARDISERALQSLVTGGCMCGGLIGKLALCAGENGFTQHWSASGQKVAGENQQRQTRREKNASKFLAKVLY